MKLTYIYHSGFAIEGDNFTVIIDYYKDTTTRNPQDGYVHRQLLKRPGRIYVLASHSHPDHFNPEILEWQEIRPDIHYIFSEDIREHLKGIPGNTVFLSKGDNWQDDVLGVRAFGSTDIGISFLIDAAAKRVFHAGDLNNWHWEEESTAEESHGYETHFLSELEILAQATDHVDLAMFPVDPRLGKDYMRGARQFVDRIRTDCFVPMHFWGKFEKANAFGDYAESKGCRFAALHQTGDQIIF